MSPLIHRQTRMPAAPGPKRRIVRAYVTPDQYRELKRTAKRARKTISAVVCEAVFGRQEVRDGE